MVNLIPIALPFLKRHGLAILAVVALLGCLWYIWDDGYDKCVQDAATQQAAKQTEAIKGREEIEHESKNFKRDELIDDLRYHGELRQTDDL